MKHLILLYYIIAFASGIVGLAVLPLLYRKYRGRSYLFYLALMALFSVNILIITLDYYGVVLMDRPFLNSNPAVSLINTLVGSAIIFLLPYCVYRFMGVRFRLFEKIFFGTAAFIMLSMFFWPFTLYKINWLYWQWIDYYGLYGMKIANIITSVTVLYVCVFIAWNLRKAADRDKKICAGVFGVSLFLFIIARSLESLRMADPRAYLMYGPVTSAHLFYIIWNAGIFYYGTKYLLKKTTLLHDIPEVFIRKYNISGREKEVITLIARGGSNKETAYDLKISVMTVKNHIHNIYQKTGMKSKVELLNLVNSGYSQ